MRIRIFFLIIPAFMTALWVADADAWNLSWPGKAAKEAKTLLSRATNAYGSADYAKVMKLTTQAIEKDPELAKAYLLRGKAGKDLGNIDQASRDLDKAISLDSGLGEAYFYRGQAHDIMGEGEEAMKSYKKGCEAGYKLACQ